MTSVRGSRSDVAAASAAGAYVQTVFVSASSSGAHQGFSECSSASAGSGTVHSATAKPSIETERERREARIRLLYQDRARIQTSPLRGPAR